MAAASAEPPPGYAALCQAAERNLGLRAKDSRQIEVDLNRSSVAVLPVPEADEEAHRAALRRLLRAWCVLRPEVGYSQAMNFVASAMLCVVEHDENAAFRLFAALLGRLPPDFYAEQPPLRGFTVEVDALLHLLERRLPSLGLTADALERVGEAMPLVLAKWFLNLWVDVLPLPCLLGAWDLMLGGGALEAAEAARSGGVALEAAAADTNVRVALALLQAAEPQLSKALGSGARPTARRRTSPSSGRRRRRRRPTRPSCFAPPPPSICRPTSSPPRERSRGRSSARATATARRRRRRARRRRAARPSTSRSLSSSSFAPPSPTATRPPPPPRRGAGAAAAAAAAAA